MRHDLLAARFGGQECFWNTIDTLWAVACSCSPADLHAEVAAVIRPFAHLPGGLMLRHYPLPEGIGLTSKFHHDSARVFADLAATPVQGTSG